ncbi:MAG: triose-phosphate isomerase [Chloroflexi bacterium]|nr:triose-phosphate isomerase [Chloroflexota bacterium]
MRQPIIAANWKMHNTVAEGMALVETMMPDLQTLDRVERVLCPPFTALYPVWERLRGTGVALGAQNVYPAPRGAYTGEISPAMLAELVEYVIVGHSERRQYFHESDEFVNRKLAAAREFRLRPILCVGENLEQNEAGQTLEVIERQLRGALAGLDALPGLVIAYEPIWAIGTGRPATPEGANQVIGAIRRLAADLLGQATARDLRIQYGGSVSPDNFAAFISQPEIDGALVGGASLKGPSFLEIVRQAATAKG